MKKGINKRANLYLYYWTIPVFFAFLALNYFTRNFKIDGIDFSLMISVVTFLFGFLVSITFSLLFNRVASLKETLAFETGRLASLFLLSKHLGQEFNKRIIEKIDDYTIKTLRYYYDYSAGKNEFYGIHEDIKYIEADTPQKRTIADSFMYILGEWSIAREKLEYLTGRRIEWSLKLANVILGIILIILLYFNRTENTFTNSLFIILSTVIIFIFLIFEDFDNLRIGDYTANISNSEELFDLIGKRRYYPESSLRKVRLVKGRHYRIGFMDPKTNIEKIYNIQYNPAFEVNVQNVLDGLHNFNKKKIKTEGSVRG